MAIVGTDQEDDELKSPQVAQPTTSASPNAHAAFDAAKGTPYGGASGGLIGGAGTGSGQGATTGVASTGGTAAGASPNPGGYTNLSQYLAVNQGGGQTAGQAATNVVQQSADAAKAAQNTFSTDATNDINTATSAVAPSQSVLGQITGGQANVDKAQMDKINSAAYGYTPNATALADPTKASQADLDAMIKAGKDATAYNYAGPSDFSKVQYGGPTIDQLTVAYGGPNTTSNFAGQTAADQNAAIAAGQTVAGNAKNAQGGQSGVSTLLRQAYAQPNYSQGENNLDAFLAGGTEGGKQALGLAPGIGQGVATGYSGITDALNGAIQKGKDTAAATNQGYKDAIAAATANSTDTQGKYNAALQAAKDTSAANQKAAEDAAKKAQAEEDRRTAIANTTPMAPKSTAEKVSDAVMKGYTDVQNALGTAGGQVANGVKTAVGNTVGLPSTAINAAKGNQAATNKLATDAATGGINVIAPQAVKPVASAAKSVVNKVASSIPHPHWAQGGEVQPSPYSKLTARLRRK